MHYKLLSYPSVLRKFIKLTSISREPKQLLLNEVPSGTDWTEQNSPELNYLQGQSSKWVVFILVPGWLTTNEKTKFNIWVTCHIRINLTGWTWTRGFRISSISKMPNHRRIGAGAESYPNDTYVIRKPYRCYGYTCIVLSVYQALCQVLLYLSSHLL